MASDFDSAWEEYMGVYNNCNPQAFIDEMQAELDRRIEDNVNRYTQERF